MVSEGKRNCSRHQQVKRKRKRIAIDQKEITVNGTTIFIWGAVDIDDEKVIAVWVSFGRSGLKAKAFLRKVRGTPAKGDCRGYS